MGKVIFSQHVEHLFFSIEVMFGPKAETVRMVHVNIFYRIDLKICGPKSEVWTKTQKLGLPKKSKISVWGPKMGFLSSIPRPKWFLNKFEVDDK